MHCPHCQFEVAADFQFCPKCGKKLSRDCPQCGYVCPLEFRYCPQCGAGVSQETTATPPPTVTVPRAPLPPVNQSPVVSASPIIAEAERRPVTVLFADVVGFTS